MTAIALDTKYVSVLESLGSAEDGLAEAVRRYATERIGEKIAQLHREILQMQAAYGIPYEMFYARVTTDDAYVESLRETHPLWERDFNTWEFLVEEQSTWLGRLEDISMD
ncbi:MAG: hypothetical protein KF753_11610 [Caldilineaceae bacterium]|nr:hypothetical protein [Caldilineaceae bacterium]